MKLRKAKILVTMGPSLQDPEVLERVFLAGASAVRINMSHGSHEQHGIYLRLIRSVAAKLNRPCAILADLMGPKIRVDRQAYILDPTTLVYLVPRSGNPTKHEIGISHSSLYKFVEAGQKILLDDGNLEIQVESVEGNRILCRVIQGGALKPNKSLNVPGVDIRLPILSAKDKADLDFIRKSGFDWLAGSFIRNRKDVDDIRKQMALIGLKIPLISKIESAEALPNLREIIHASDGVMVARGDLGVEVDLEFIPTIQRNVIHIAREMGKVTIVATQMLETMTTQPRPTRAEVTDVSTAALDRVDALMLSGETAAGKYPVESVRMMDRIIATTEKNLEEEIVSINHPESIALTCEAGVYFALIAAAKAVVTVSTHGQTPRILSTYRGNMPVIVACTQKEIFNRSTLYYSVLPIMVTPKKDPEKLFLDIEKQLKEKKMVGKGDTIILMFGYPFHVKNGTNSIRKWIVE